MPEQKTKPAKVPISNIVEPEFEATLRPTELVDFIGQERIKQNLNIALMAAKKRNEPLEHVLFYGPPGLGKTTLAHVVSNELGRNIKVTSGPAIDRAGDLASILTGLEEGDVLFIDEIHRLNKAVEEMLYPAMEDFVIDLIVGKGPAAKTLRLDLPHFTLIGATTRASLISSPMRDRFGHIYHLDFYGPGDIKEILKRSAKILRVNVEEDGLTEIANRSRKTPRIANRLLKRVRDYSEVADEQSVSIESARAALEQLAIDEMGLDEVDRKILSVLQSHFGGGPAGIESIAAAIAQDRQTIEDVCEPYLLQIGFIERTPKGRRLTPNAKKHLGVKLKDLSVLPGME